MPFRASGFLGTAPHVTLGPALATSVATALQHRPAKMSHSKCFCSILAICVSDYPGKRNTSRPVFTAHERNLAKAAWGSSTARLSRESFLPFASCGLCLEPAIDPVACIHGDIFCRECALSNIVAQKKEIKRLEKVKEQEERAAVEEQARQELEAQERAVHEFELTQAGLDVRSREGKDRTAGSPDPEAKRGEKRKFSLDEDEMARIAAEERTRARKAIDDEKVRLVSADVCVMLIA